MMISRRELLARAAQSGLVLTAAPLAQGFAFRDASSLRCINVVNFIRGVEPREEMDLLLPVQRQMDEILRRHLPATWLLQYDALVTGPFVDLLKARMASDHEVGFWFEMNEKLCDAAGVEWRGRPGYEWDSQPSVAFTIGYREEERIKLADAAMAGFRSVWSQYPRSVASWNLDSITMAHLSTRYGIDAFAVCRDQITTDGFTIWGAPIAGYYPSKVNCWSPALSPHNQIGTPVFRMLGQDPVYYYYRGYPLRGGQQIGEPDTMEPVWTSGRSAEFVKHFLGMISESPSLRFAYAQLGQENNFGWPAMAEAYSEQMSALARLREAGIVHVETLGQTGRRFKSSFDTTPPQSQVILDDPFGNTAPAEKTIWYQSRYYRANLHFKGDLPYFRDLTVYSDRFPQPFLNSATRESDVEQRMLSALDGYHWSATPGSLGEPGAAGFFSVGGERLRLRGEPRVYQAGDALVTELPVRLGTLQVRFDAREITVGMKGSEIKIEFEWDSSKASLTAVSPKSALFHQDGFAYSVGVLGGLATSTEKGWTASQTGREIRLLLAQPY
jgi:hypothetical protein